MCYIFYVHVPDLYILCGWFNLLSCNVPLILFNFFALKYNSPDINNTNIYIWAFFQVACLVFWYMLLCFRSNLHKAHTVRFYFTIQSDSLLLNESFIVIIAIFTLISIILFSVLCLPYFFTFLIFLEFINFIFHFFLLLD